MGREFPFAPIQIIAIELLMDLASYLGSLALGHALAEARTAAFATWLLGHIVTRSGPVGMSRSRGGPEGDPLL